MDNHQAEWDARTLAEANVIKADPARKQAAESAAKQLADKEAEEAKAMRQVARGTSPRTKAVRQDTARTEDFLGNMLGGK